MASSRIKPFPLYGLVPYRGALYTITRDEVFRGDRLYRLDRSTDSGHDRRVLINHWDVLTCMEQQAHFQVGDAVRHAVLGNGVVAGRSWRFSVGRVVYRVAFGTLGEGTQRCWDEELSAAAVPKGHAVLEHHG